MANVIRRSYYRDHSRDDEFSISYQCLEVATRAGRLQQDGNPALTSATLSAG